MPGLYNRSLFLKRLTWILEKTWSLCRVNSRNMFGLQLLIRWFALSFYWTLKFLYLNIDKVQNLIVSWNQPICNVYNYFGANDNMKETHLFRLRASLFQALGSWERKKWVLPRFFFSLVFARPQLPGAWNVNRLPSGGNINKRRSFWMWSNQKKKLFVSGRAEN